MADRDSRGGLTYLTKDIGAFVDRVHAAHDPLLERAFSAPEHNAMPAIQLAASEGKLLTLLMRLIGARKVVEFGTLAGYSALRIARGLAAGGKLWTLELEPRHAQIARANITAAGLAQQIEVLVGPALESLAALEAEGPFDAVFLDADKGGYLDYARWAQSALRPGGMLLADNAYYFAQLMDESEEASRMRQFHEFVGQAFDSVCMSTPDGLVLALK